MIQEQEQRRSYYDKDLKIEAYNLSGVVQKFPNHFHEYYVIGFVEGGKKASLVPQQRVRCQRRGLDSLQSQGQPLLRPHRRGASGLPRRQH